MRSGVSRKDAALLRHGLLWSFIDRQLDFFYSIITATYAVGLTSLTRAARWNVASVALGPIKIAGIIDMHAVLFAEIMHPTQGMSPWSYAAGAFSVWFLFSDAFGKGIPAELAMQSFAERKISLPVFLLFNMFYYTWSTILAVLISVLPFYLLDPFFGSMALVRSSNNVGVDIPALLSFFALAFFFGFNLGALVKKLSKIFPPLSVLVYICIPPMFFLSGVYTSYVYMPDMVQDVMLFSPMLPVVEGCRHALDAGYWSAEATPWYPFALALACFLVVLLMDNIKRRSGSGEAKRSR